MWFCAIFDVRKPTEVTCDGFRSISNMSDFLCDGHVFLSKQVALILKVGGWREKCWTLFRINILDYNVESTKKDIVNNVEIITHRAYCQSYSNRKAVSLVSCIIPTLFSCRPLPYFSCEMASLQQCSSPLSPLDGKECISNNNDYYKVVALIPFPSTQRIAKPIRPETWI